MSRTQLSGSKSGMKRLERLPQLNPMRVATVVVRRAPVSAHLGDRAIVTADGRMDGFVGGSCSRDIVRRQGLDAIRTGIARLVQIRPDPPSARGRECRDGGRADGLRFRRRRRRVHRAASAGAHACSSSVTRRSRQHSRSLRQRSMAIACSAWSPATSLQRSASEDAAAARIEIESLAGYLAALGAQRERLVAVVASQGHYDERALATLLSGEPQAFVGLLASRKRAASVFGALEQEGISRATTRGRCAIRSASISVRARRATSRFRSSPRSSQRAPRRPRSIATGDTTAATPERGAAARGVRRARLHCRATTSLRRSSSCSRSASRC